METEHSVPVPMQFNGNNLWIDAPSSQRRSHKLARAIVQKPERGLSNWHPLYSTPEQTAYIQWYKKETFEKTGLQTSIFEPIKL